MQLLFLFRFAAFVIGGISYGSLLIDARREKALNGRSDYWREKRTAATRVLITAALVVGLISVAAAILDSPGHRRTNDILLAIFSVFEAASVSVAVTLGLHLREHRTWSRQFRRPRH